MGPPQGNATLLHGGPQAWPRGDAGWPSPGVLRCLLPRLLGGHPCCPGAQHGMKPLAAAAARCRPCPLGAAEFEPKVPLRQAGGCRGQYPPCSGAGRCPCDPGQDLAHVPMMPGRLWEQEGPRGARPTAPTQPHGRPGDAPARVVPGGPATTLPPAHAPHGALHSSPHVAPAGSLPSSSRSMAQVGGQLRGAQQHRGGQRGQGQAGRTAGRWKCHPQPCSISFELPPPGAPAMAMLMDQV